MGRGSGSGSRVRAWVRIRVVGCSETPTMRASIRAAAEAEAAARVAGGRGARHVCGRVVGTAGAHDDVVAERSGHGQQEDTGRRGLLHRFEVVGRHQRQPKIVAADVRARHERRAAPRRAAGATGREGRRRSLAVRRLALGGGVGG
eukprot:3678388-Prymnesium_polylepis.1